MKQNTYRLLVVEDDAPLRNALTDKFRREGFSVEAAENGELGLAVIRANVPDCVLLDVRMPKMNGFDLLHNVRAMPSGKELPVILLTNVSEIEQVSEALTLGVQDYLIKSSWRLDDIVQKVKEKLKIQTTPSTGE